MSKALYTSQRINPLVMSPGTSIEKPNSSDRLIYIAVQLSGSLYVTASHLDHVEGTSTLGHTMSDKDKKRTAWHFQQVGP